MSGLNQQFTKLSSWKRLREFESHILRPKGTSILPRQNMARRIRNAETIFCACDTRSEATMYHLRQHTKVSVSTHRP